MKLTQEEKEYLIRGYEDLYKHFDLEDLQYELFTIEVTIEKDKFNKIYLEEKIKELKIKNADI